MVYLDGAKYYNSTDATFSEYFFTNLTVGRNYLIEIAARNRIGEGAKAQITLLAASLPPKLQLPDFMSATLTSITVNASKPLYTGGSDIIKFVYRRNNGPLTDF